MSMSSGSGGGRVARREVGARRVKQLPAVSEEGGGGGGAVATAGGGGGGGEIRRALMGLSKMAGA